MRPPLRGLLPQVKQQNFCVFHCFDRQLLLFAYGRAVASAELLAVQFDFALSNLEPGVTLGSERLGDFFSGCKQGDEQLCVLIDLYRTVGTVVRGDQAQVAALLGFGEATSVGRSDSR